MKRKMLRKSFKAMIVPAFAALMFTLTACGGNEAPVTPAPGGEATTGQTTAPPPPTLPPVQITDDNVEAMQAVNALADLDELVAQFPIAVVNNNTPIEGGILRVARAQNAAFPGVLLPTHSTDATDSTIQSFMGQGTGLGQNGSIFRANLDLTVSDQGIATMDVDVENRTITIRMRDDIPTVYWHDGVPLTLDDMLFAYEIISHPDYTGIRFSGTGVHLIVGAEEMKAGEADYISGAILSEDKRELVLHFIELPPSLRFSGGLWSTPVARHHWSHIPHAEMIDHPYTRTNPLGFGPFIFDNVIPGESISFVRNDNYWQGRPYLDGIVFEVVSQAVAPLATEHGEFDIMIDWTPTMVADHIGINNAQILGDIAQSGGFHTFRLGVMHTGDDGLNYFVPNGDRYDNPIHEPLVRHAIGHALDQLSISMTLGRGLTRPATSVLWPFNSRHWMDPYHLGHAPHNPDLANELLDQAGLTARDSEGYRLDFNGNPWTLTWAQNPGADDDVLLAVRQQNLREVGIRMRLWQDDFVDFNFLMDTFVTETNNDMDIVSQGWNFGWAPNPSSLWGVNNFNRARYYTPEWSEIQSAISSEEAWDPEFLAYWMSRWEQAFYEAAVALPLTYGLAYNVVNNRVQGYSMIRGGIDNGNSPHLWRLTAETPYVHN